MHKRDRILLFISVVLVIVIASLSGSVGSKGLLSQQEVDVESYPIIDIDSPGPSDPVKRKLQEARKREHNINDKNVSALNLKNFVLKETDPPILLDLTPTHGDVEQPLPVANSDVVVIGQVTNPIALLSSDETSVFSEFNVEVEEVLKDCQTATLNSGDVIAATRRGGRVRFPSGKTLLRGSVGKGMPKAGHRYLFFLKYSHEGQNYPIITAYELRDEKVFPLDRGILAGRDQEKAGVSAYDGVDAVSLISKVKNAIASRIWPSRSVWKPFQVSRKNRRSISGARRSVDLGCFSFALTIATELKMKPNGPSSVNY